MSDNNFPAGTEWKTSHKAEDSYWLVQLFLVLEAPVIIF